MTRRKPVPESFRNSHLSRSVSAKGTDDDFSTPNWATDILFRHIKFSGPIWEPACGSGKMAERIKQHGYKVIATTLKNRGYGKTGIDFTEQRKLLASNIVTNPPYNILKSFVRHALSSKANYICLLLRTAFLESKWRRPLFKKYKPYMVIAITDRVLFNGSEEPGGGYFLSWFIWKRNFRGETKLRIDYKQGEPNGKHIYTSSNYKSTGNHSSIHSNAKRRGHVRGPKQSRKTRSRAAPSTKLFS